MKGLDLSAAQNDYAALQCGMLQGYAMPELTLVAIELATEVLIDRQSADAKVAAYEAKHIGWSRRESWSGRTPLVAGGSNDEVGPPLDGEWRVSQSESVRLVYEGSLWRFITIREVNDRAIPATNSSKRRDALKEYVHLVAKPANDGGRDHGFLCYAVYWGAPDPNDVSGIRRIASRFIDFVQEPE